MRRIVGLGLLAVLLLAVRPASAEIAALAYHDIVPARNGDPYAITVKDFERQMAYLHRAGYQPIGLRTLAAARAGKTRLPPKPVLLTFDDGYRSYYRYAYPVLRRYGFPSIVSIVTSWVDRRSAPDYLAAEIMSWDELREVARSPLVDVLSHTDNLHHSVPSNPIDARTPAAVARLYDAASATYETDEAHRRRVAADLTRSATRIRAELGISPAGITWPYGKYEATLVQVAAELGMHYHLTLDAEPSRLADLPRINRTTFRDYRGLAGFGDALTFRDYRKQQLRFAEIDLAGIADQPPSARAQRIAQLVRRVELLRLDAVVLRPFAPDGRQTYFHTAAMPVAADVLSEIGYQLENRGGLPHLYLSLPAAADAGALTDLARLNWFTGAVVEGAPDAGEFGRTAALLRRYKPALKLGVRAAAAPAAASADFVLVDLAADAPAHVVALAVEQASQGPARPLFLLARSAATTDELLRERMGMLRAAGAAHYGYGLDDYLNNAPAALAIVRSLTEHTVVRPGR